MTRAVFILCFLMTVLQGFCGGKPVPLADPFILLHEGVYYAYGTYSGEGIAVYTSTDLKRWKPAGLALNRKDVWGNQWFWAPEVYKDGDEFIMYYSAEEHICAARGKSPLGPFVQQKKRTMLDEGKNIDHTLFRDDDGRPYIFFVRFQGGNIIWSGELEASLDKIKPGTMKRCIGPEQPWEKVRANVNEGAALLKHQGKYYLTYSGNDYQSQKYGIGYAVADSLEGPWKKAEENPILQSPGDLVGVGHHAFFRDKEGRLMVAFHAHNSRTAVHPRLMHITTAYFQDGRLVISPDYFTPSLEE